MKCMKCGHEMYEGESKEYKEPSISLDPIKTKSNLLDELLEDLEGDEINNKIQVIIAKKKKKPEEE